MWGKNNGNRTQMWGRRTLCCINSRLELLTLPRQLMHTIFFTLTKQTTAETYMQMCSCHSCQHSELTHGCTHTPEMVESFFLMQFMRNVWRGSQREKITIWGFRYWSFKPPRLYGFPSPRIPGTYEYWNILPNTISIQSQTSRSNKERTLCSFYSR